MTEWSIGVTLDHTARAMTSRLYLWDAPLNPYQETGTVLASEASSLSRGGRFTEDSRLAPDIHFIVMPTELELAGCAQ